MLDILEKFLIRKGYCFSRLDGATPMSSRQALVDEFNSSPSKQVFLISTRAGGLGLNLVSANRVVIFDPNWNPAQDLQAQDRSFRYGQKRHVIVFRLLAAGSIEELVYSRQIYKQQLSNIAVSGKMEKRYFEGVQDCKQFQGELFGICNLFRDLSDKLFTSEIIELHENRGLECGDSHGTKEDSTEHGMNPINKNFLTIHKFVDYPFPKKANRAFLSGSEDRKSGDAFMDKKDQPVLEELGIVYAHRNEDIVNTRPEFQANKDASSCEIDDSIMTKELSSNSISMKRQLNKDASVCESDDGMVTMPSSRNKNLMKRQASKDARLVGNNDNIVTKQSGSKNASGEEASSVKRKKSSEFGLLAQFMGMEKLEFSKWLLSASRSQREKVLRDYKSKKS